MKAIILAAGRGTRLGQLGQTIPKALIKINRQTILGHTLAVLSPEIDEIIIVTGHLEEKIRENFGNRFAGAPIRYVNQGEMAGTAGALWAARKFIPDGRFLVLNSDDIYSRKDLEECLKHPLAIGLRKEVPKNPKILAIDIDGNKNLTGWHRPAYPPAGGEKNGKIWVATGCYVLDNRIFNLEPVRLSSGEYGLPQTLFKMIGNSSIVGVEMPDWLSINTPEDIEAAKNNFGKNGGFA